MKWAKNEIVNSKLIKMRAQKSFGFASGCRWKQRAMEKSADEMKYLRKILERLHRDLEDYTNLLCKIFAGKISRIRCALKLKLNMIRERWTEQCVAWEHEHDMISPNWTKYILPFHPLRCLYRGIWTGCAAVFMKTRNFNPIRIVYENLDNIGCIVFTGERKKQSPSGKRKIIQDSICSSNSFLSRSLFLFFSPCFGSQSSRQRRQRTSGEIETCSIWVGTYSNRKIHHPKILSSS